jgi:4-hydroxy-4-methyl-2-oxoglutarate aldolase
MAEWDNDEQLFSLIRNELYTPVVGDILDRHGRYHQFLPPAIRPLDPRMVVVGFAMPVLQIQVFGPQQRPFGRLTEALDALRPGEVYVGTGGALNCANWGEIMTAAAKARGAVGAVVNGYHRDTPQVLEQDFPAFSRGGYAQDSGVRMQVVDFRCPIEIGQASIQPGDLVFGDLDGVLIVPADLIDAVITGALEKSRAEKAVRREIEQGLSATDALKKYGIL